MPFAIYFAFHVFCSLSFILRGLPPWQEEESVRLELHELEAESISYANQLQAIDASIVQTTENVRILAEKAEDTKVFVILFYST